MAASPTIVFSHANGFPAGTYRLMLEAWRAAGFRVVALERIGHDPAFAVTSNWPRLREQLVQFIEREVGGPATLVGHSLGGALSVLVASRRPDLVDGLVLLDAPVLRGWRAHSLHVMKTTGLLERVSPGRVSRRRRQEWADRTAVQAHFAGKTAFARWDPRVLADYVASGFDEIDGKVVLGFRREIETRIYNSLPHHFGTLLRRHPLRCPLAFLAGMQSVELRQGGVASVRALAGENFEWREGSHLFPMEHPEETAQAVLRWIERLRQPDGTPSI